MSTMRRTLLAVGAGLFLLNACFSARGYSGEPQTPDQKKDSGSTTEGGSPPKSTIPDEYKGDVDLLIGIGSQVVSPSSTDYQIVNNSTIQAVNLGQATPQFLTGLSFKLPWHPVPWRKAKAASAQNPPAPAAAANIASPPSSDSKTLLTQNKTAPSSDNAWMEYPWHVFVSAKFTPGSQDGINGYVLGLTFRVAKYLDLLGGYTLAPQQQITPGFQAVAVQAVMANPSAYSAFDLSKLESNSKHAFDGFPIQKQGTGASGNLYGGNPLTTHYTGGLVIGIAFPLDLSNLLKQGSVTSR